MIVDLYFGSCRVTVDAASGLIAKLRRDFSWFSTQRVPSQRRVGVTAVLQPPDWSEVRGWYFFTHFNGRVYGWGDRRWVRYSDSLVAYDAAANQGRVASLDDERLHHYTYYLIIALVGMELDALGFHRFHALGVAVEGRTALFSMPITGGKTTLGLALMKDPAVELYSEDTPLIDRRGFVHPFTVRLSLREGDAAAIPVQFLRQKNDPVSGRKILVDLEYFGLERIAAAPGANALVFWSVKSRQPRPSVRALPSWRSLALLLYQIVVGKDCPQRAEVILRLSPGGIRMIAALLHSRALAAWALWRSSRLYRFYMSPDIAANAEFIRQFIRAHGD